MRGTIAGLIFRKKSFLKTRKSYEDHVYQDRIQNILTNIKTHKPEIVLLYGMNNINTLKQSIQDFFPSASKFKMVKGIKLEIPQHHRAKLDGTTIIITTHVPALKHNRIETGFDWEKFGMECKKPPCKRVASKILNHDRLLFPEIEAV